MLAEDYYEDLPLLKGDPKTITVSGAKFTMTGAEWDQVKDWIAKRQQERLMRWWAEQFGIPHTAAVGIVNRVQVALEFGILS